MVVRIILAGVLLLGLLFSLRLVMLAHGSRDSVEAERPTEAMTQLSPCPDRRNCVGSLETDPARRVEPLPAGSSVETTLARLAEIIGEMRGARVVSRSGSYLRAEFSSRLFGFVDDLELLSDPTAGVIQVRSASRAGYSDLGVNRKRIETLREKLIPLV